MELVKKLEPIITAVFEDTLRYVKQADFNAAYSRYCALIEPALNRYQLHHNVDKENYDLQIRFRAETSILHVLTVLSSSLLKDQSSNQVAWPSYETDSFYNWYRIPDAHLDEIKLLTNFETKFEQLPQLFSQISDTTLALFSQRHVGEFYTPLSIAQHLIELAQFAPELLFCDKKLVDPACGGGIILSLIAQQVINYGLDIEKTPYEILETLSTALWGFDIQPFAIALTRTQLILISIPIIKEIGLFSGEKLFPNILLSDPLKDQTHYWEVPEEKFFFNIGNPPYMSVKKACIEYIDKYEKVLYGHPNLYQLFLWWAVNSTSENGIISFLIPQSILVGNFLQNLRVALLASTQLLSISRMIDRKGVVGEADHQMMALCLQIKQNPSEDTLVNIRVTRNGADLFSSNLYEVKHSRVVHKISETAIVWIVSDSALDYSISEKVKFKCKTLAELEIIEVGNGGYVWNQHKNLLCQEEKPDLLPLISSASIKPFNLEFPFLGSHPSRERQYSAINAKVFDKIHSEPCVLLQRVTPKKAGRRVFAGYVDHQFLQTYPQYFLENHVNYIKVLPMFHTNNLRGILGWLNSDILNFVFQLRNGTSHLSIFELGLLPIASELLPNLSNKVETILELSSDLKQEKHITELNEFIFDWFDLGPRHRKRILEVLNRKERE